MTIAYQGFLGGESRDTLVDGGFITASPADWSIVTTPIQTGVAAWQCNADGTQDNLSVGQWWTGTGNVGGFLSWVNVSGTPTAAFPLAGEASNDRLALEVATDRKVRLVQLGSGGGIWSGRAALSAWSADVLPTSGFVHVAWFHDQATPASGSLHTLFLDEVQQWAVHTSVRPDSPNIRLAPGLGGVDSGINVTFDDAVLLFSFSAADAPHLTAWPKAEVHRQLAIGDTATDAWGKAGDALGTGDFGEWDDAAGNDGDTSFNWADNTSLAQKSDGQTAATVGITGHTVITAGSTDIAPIMQIVHRIQADGGSKFSGFVQNSLGPSNAVGEPGGTYEGDTFAMQRSSGSWTVADLAAIEFGLGTGASGHDEEWRATLCMLQWCTYDSTLPLTKLPERVTGQIIG
jgi:hypothetical protein